jgi:MFS family permease
MTTAVESLRASFHTMRGNTARLLLSGAIFLIPVGLLSVSAPIYMKRLGIDEVLIGAFLTTMGIVAVALVIPFGLTADRFGRKNMLILGGILAVAGFGVLGLATTYPVFIVAALLGGAAEACYFSSWNAVLADAAAPGERTAVFGMSFFLTQMAFGMGNLWAIIPDALLSSGAVSAADPHAAYGPAYLGGAALLALSPILLTRVVLPKMERVEGASLLPKRSFGIISKFLVSNLIVGLGAGLIIPLFTLWFFLKFGMAESVTGPLLALSNFVNAFAFLLAPWISEKYGMVRSIVTVQAVATALLFFIPIAPWLLLVGVLFVLRSVLMNMTWPVASSFLMGAVHPEERAAASAVTGASFRLPFAISTSFGGYLLTQDLSMPFFVTTLLYAVGTAAFWVFFRGMDEKEAAAVSDGMSQP